MAELQQEIQKLINTHQTSMTQYQIDHFVVGEKMTPYRILRQILMELETRYRNLEITKRDKKIEELRIKQAKARMDKTTDAIDKEIQELEIEKREIDLDSISKTELNTVYEINVLEAQFQKLKSEFGDMSQVLNDPNGEEEYWINKFIKEAQVDIMTTGRVGKGVLDAIMSLPNEHQHFIIQNAVSQAANSNMYISGVEDHTINMVKDAQKVELMLDTIVKKSTEE